MKISSKNESHDPYAAEVEKNNEDHSAADAEKIRNLLQLARHRKVGGRGGEDNDEFARKMFLGLKEGKKRGGEKNELGVASSVSGDVLKSLEQQSSSSEDEYIDIEDTEENEEDLKINGKGDDEHSENNSQKKKKKRSDQKKKISQEKKEKEAQKDREEKYSRFLRRK